MPSYTWMVPAVVLLLAAAASASAQSPRDPGAAANVRQSEQYTQMLRSSPTFRAQRMQLECGPINDPELLASCVASFQAYGPTPPPRKRGRWTQEVMVLPDDVPGHPVQTSIDVASLAPNAEITVFLWKEPEELKQRTIDRVRRFLKAHEPMRAAPQ